MTQARIADLGMTGRDRRRAILEILAILGLGIVASAVAVEAINWISVVLVGG